IHIYAKLFFPIFCLYHFIATLCTPRPALSPYTTLFRSDDARAQLADLADSLAEAAPAGRTKAPYADTRKVIASVRERLALLDLRSEEHTSERQSRENLVCRLLLEKKKKYQYENYIAE